MQIENAEARTSVVYSVKHKFHSDSLCRGFILRTGPGIKLTASGDWCCCTVQYNREKCRDAPGRHKQLSNPAQLLFRSFASFMPLCLFYPRNPSPEFLLSVLILLAFSSVIRASLPTCSYLLNLQVFPSLLLDKEIPLQGNTAVLYYN